jgi:L-ribulokinase
MAPASADLDPTEDVSANGFVVGVDYGTLSARAVVVRASDGAELGSAVHEYANGVIERTLPAGGPSLPSDWALQDPSDYIEALRQAVPAAVRAAGIDASDVVGIATDFTASTPLPVLSDGTPLCWVPELAERPHAWPKLWKHHAAQAQADRVNAVAAERDEPWLPRYGGRISSEWEFAKALQVLDEDPDMYARTDLWVEAADWIIWQLSGRYVRNVCATGYKAIYQDGHYPSEDYLRALDERFGDFLAKLDGPLGQLGERAGSLTAEAAEWTGLPEGIAVAVGNVDAHVTAPAARAIDPGQMLAVMGTSTCHVMNGDVLGEVPGMCGVVNGGVVPGLYGYEAGQSGVGDIFAWFVENSVPPAYHDAARAAGVDLHTHLSDLAGRQRVGQHGLVALDWHSGNRSILVDHELSGLIVGLTLATRPEDIYRALLESTAFGTRKIIEAFESSGVPVRELIAAGGLIKNAVLMQMYADVTRRRIHLIESEQGAALGSAMHAAVAAGVHPDIRAAAAAMGKVRRDAYIPDEERATAYDALYTHYSNLHDRFANGETMHSLRRLRGESPGGDSLASSLREHREVAG